VERFASDYFRASDPTVLEGVLLWCAGDAELRILRAAALVIVKQLSCNGVLFSGARLMRSESSAGSEWLDSGADVLQQCAIPECAIGAE
jgi:hypothetical protein